MNLNWHDYGDGEHATQYPAGFVILRMAPGLWALSETVPRGHGSKRWNEGVDHGEHKTLKAAKAAAELREAGA